MNVTVVEVLQMSYYTEVSLNADVGGVVGDDDVVVVAVVVVAADAAAAAEGEEIMAQDG